MVNKSKRVIIVVQSAFECINYGHTWLLCSVVVMSFGHIGYSKETVTQTLRQTIQRSYNRDRLDTIYKLNKLILVISLKFQSRLKLPKIQNLHSLFGPSVGLVREDQRMLSRVSNRSKWSTAICTETTNKSSQPFIARGTLNMLTNLTAHLNLKFFEKGLEKVTKSLYCPQKSSKSKDKKFGGTHCT